MSLVLIVALVCVFAFPQEIVHAAAITSASDTMSSSKINATSTHAIKFTSPSGADGAGEQIVITFPSDFNFSNKATSSVTFSHGATTGLETTETLHGVTDADRWSVATSGTQGRVWTFTAPTDGIGVGAVTAGQVLVFSFTAATSTNPSVATSYVITISGSFGDSGDITVNILNDDQVSITATVPQSLTFSISDNSISFGSLSAVAARYASGTASGDTTEVEAHNLIVGTNAANGYSMTLNGNTLTSGANTINPIGSLSSSSSVGTEQFGLRLVASGGSGVVNAPYASSTSGFAFDTGSFPDTVATSTTASANTTYSARYLANITSNTEAGSYTATLTYTATANY